MRWCCRLLVVVIISHVALTGYLIAKSAMRTQPTHPTHTAPMNWKYAAAKASHTFHAKGCPGLPKQLDPEQMVYGNSVREMLATRKEPCPQCINQEGP